MLLIGTAMTASLSLALVVAGIGVVTIGFSAPTRSRPAGSEGERGRAGGLTAAFTPVLRYLGSSVLRSAGGIAWTSWGWNRVALFLRC